MVATLGTTGTGSLDPLPQLLPLQKRYGFRLHVDAAYGGYYTLGRTFVKLIGKPGLMRFATRHGMSRPALMRFALKLLANLTDPRGDASDRLVNGLSRLAPNPE